MHTLRETLEVAVTEALVSVSGVSDAKGQVIPATRAEFGDYQANGVMAVARQLRSNPRELALQVIEKLECRDLLAKAEVAGPGFINLFLADSALAQRADNALKEPATLILPVDSPQTIVVDYSGPNLAKEMHVGHLRTTVVGDALARGTSIGDALARILAALGHRIIRQNHVGDWGTQFGMLIAHMESLANVGHDTGSTLADLEAFYRDAKQRFDQEPEFADLARQYVVRLQQGDAACLAAWQRFIDESLKHCEDVYALLSVLLTRDDLRAESSYNSDLPAIVKELQDSGLAVESDGAQCVFLDDFIGKDGTPLPVIVQKSDGGYLYATTDLAAIRDRSHSLQADRVLYVVDARQSLHFQQVFTLANRAGFSRPNTSLEHIAYGTMMGADGKPFKTRSGDTVKLRDLLDEAVRRAHELVDEKNPDLDAEEKAEIARTVGIAAVKYADLSKNRTSDYIFDWSSMLSFEGNTAPYMLYAYARIQSVLRRLTAESSQAAEQIQISAPEERVLLLKILQLPEVIRQVGNECYPNQLCLYLYELAGVFMKFYESCPILKAETTELRGSRQALAVLTAPTLKRGLNLLGMEPLNRM